MPFHSYLNYINTKKRNQMYYARHHNKQNMRIFFTSLLHAHEFCSPLLWSASRMSFLHLHLSPRRRLGWGAFQAENSPLSTRLTSQMDVMSVCDVELYTMSTVVYVGVWASLNIYLTEPKTSTGNLQWEWGSIQLNERRHWMSRRFCKNQGTTQTCVNMLHNALQ